jgi:hypothetical protein
MIKRAELFCPLFTYLFQSSAKPSKEKLRIKQSPFRTMYIFSIFFLLKCIFENNFIISTSVWEIEGNNHD